MSWGTDGSCSVSEGKRILRTAFQHLERELPEWAARMVRSLRHPDARWVRIPVGVLFLLGGVFSILPVLGIWMLPLGLLLLAYDVPFMRKPVARFTIWTTQKWAAFRGGATTGSPAEEVKHSRRSDGGPL
jgi:hypothetical protein